MNKDLVVRESIHLKHSPEEVWRVLTDPEEVRKYFFGTKLECDWKTGSPIVFKGEWNGQEYVDKGTILELIPGRKIVYDYWSSVGGTPDIPENYSIITYSLTPRENDTLLEITQQGFENEEKRDHSVAGWKMVIQNLQEVISAKELA